MAAVQLRQEVKHGAHQRTMHFYTICYKNWLTLDARPPSKWRSWVSHSTCRRHSRAVGKKKQWGNVRIVVLYSRREPLGGEMPVREIAAIRIISTTAGVVTFSVLLRMVSLSVSGAL